MKSYPTICGRHRYRECCDGLGQKSCKDSVWNVVRCCREDSYRGSGRHRAEEVCDRLGRPQEFWWASVYEARLGIQVDSSKDSG